ncbi:DUF4335 domain-containing protein [Leptolyngbya sp. FACHB-261]|uniref:DUF4335 domain-containing protein n=1 Tax=Leptolyngbya sp. FACHB-261 TaxID=2692806 RepID=UPI0016875F8D|nr:DUF4335 domain-containing protein [Leptolyngbya sp. FACHB-261]MBD2099680.1 DUF4335 domain-containing protein [Leptolyngbya sp. FACHB-261]
MLTLVRTYNLPNCTLTLEGIAAPNNAYSERPPLSILTNFECNFLGLNSPLSGNRELLEALNSAVSQYAQSLLSGVSGPSKPSLVRVERQGLDRHVLTLRQPPQDGSPNGTTAPTDQQAEQRLELSTVQLFDLVEALDQLGADTQTLPELQPHFTPVSRRYSPHRAKPVEQAAPALFGLTGLAVAAVAFFFVPIPNVRPPEPVPSQTSSSTATPVPTPTATAPPTISDSQAISSLRQQIYDEIDKAWRTTPTFRSDLTYRLSVNANGLLTGYRALDANSEQFVRDTPLQSLLYVPVPTPNATPSPVETSSTSQEPTAQFEATFTPDGKLSVEPYTEPATSESETATPAASP